MKLATVFRRILCLALVAVLLSLTAAPAFAAGKSSPEGSYVVTASRLNVHGSAGYGNVIARLKKGTVVTYSNTRKGWWYVRYSNGSGYVDSKYLAPVSTGTSARYAPTVNLRVRAKASIDGFVIGKIRKGLKVKVLRQSGSWAYIDYKGNRGWVSAKYLKRVK